MDWYRTGISYDGDVEKLAGARRTPMLTNTRRSFVADLLLKRVDDMETTLRNS
jgi:hypothetical protein